MDKLCQSLAKGVPVGLQDIISSWQQHLPLLPLLSATPQDSVWHGEGNVAIHTGMVLDEVRRALPAAALSADESFTLQLGAILHDIGKPLVTQSREIDGRERIVSPRHAERGRNHLALRLPLLELPSAVEDSVMALTGYHHHPRRLVHDEAPPASWRRLARLCPVRLVYWLEQADLRGRVCPDLAEQLDCIELFRLRCEELGLWDTDEPWADWRGAIDEAFPSRSPAFRRHALHAAIRDAESGIIQSVEEGIARAWQLRDPPAELTLLCGPSGAGKSEWIQAHAKDTAVISLDALREEIVGKRADQSMNGQVIQAAKERLKAHLRKGTSVIWDATNLRRDGRGWVIQLGLDYHAHVRIVALQTPVPVLQSRNRQRPHPVPGSVLEHQIESIEWPTADEAHELITVRYMSKAH